MKIKIVVLSLVLMITLSFAQTPEESRAYFINSDLQLNEIYQKLIAANRTDTMFVKNLRNSQRAWLQFRDAQLTLIYPDHSSIENIDLLAADELVYLAYLTDNRTKVLSEMLNPSTAQKVYVSDLEVIRTANINGGIGLDKPYWTDDIVICGKRYTKGVVIHPKQGGVVAYAEFLIPKSEGHLTGVAGWANGGSYSSHNGRMRYRIFVDGQLLYGNEITGKECRGLDLDLGSGKVLRIETDDGGDLNYSDHMAFGDLRIIYQGKDD